MTKVLDDYLQQFSKIKTDKNKNRWSALTCHCAPHKPFLLLSILDLIGSGSISNNFIEPGFELAESFSRYWQKVMPLGTSSSMSYPFYHLDTSDFWQLQPQPGCTHRRGLTVGSVKRLRELYLGAKFADDLWPFLLKEVTREQFRAKLISTFFAPEIHSVLFQQSTIHFGAAEYCSTLLQTNEAQLQYGLQGDQKEETKKAVRDQGFRKAIVPLYAHRCAMCGIRMLTPEGHTIVEAAHIIPWCESHNDKPQNGMSLCRLCHWSFDEGLMSVGKDYEVLVSPAVRQDNNFPGHMEMLSGRGIFKPDEHVFWPDQENLDYHRSKRFRKK